MITSKTLIITIYADDTILHLKDMALCDNSIDFSYFKIKFNLLCVGFFLISVVQVGTPDSTNANRLLLWWRPQGLQL